MGRAVAWCAYCHAEILEHFELWLHLDCQPPKPDPEPDAAADKRESWQIIKKWNHLSTKMNRMLYPEHPSWRR